MFRPVGRNIELNSEGIEAKSAVASHFIYEIRERFAQTFLRRTHVDLTLKEIFILTYSVIFFFKRIIFSNTNDIYQTFHLTCSYVLTVFRNLVEITF